MLGMSYDGMYHVPGMSHVQYSAAAECRLHFLQYTGVWLVSNVPNVQPCG